MAELIGLPGLPAPHRVLVFLAFLLPGVSAGMGVWRVAKHDLEEMGQGRRDPEGERLTNRARSYGLANLVLAIIALGFWGLCAVVILAVRPFH